MPSFPPSSSRRLFPSIKAGLTSSSPLASYQRVRRAQLTGEKNRDAWHKTESKDAKANPDKVKLPREEWLLGHDSEKHAMAVYKETAKEIREQGYKLPELPVDEGSVSATGEVKTEPVTA
jgi:hypothetical protein